MPKPLSDIGLVGLAVMGQNLALNIADHGFQHFGVQPDDGQDGEVRRREPGHAGRLVGDEDPGGICAVAGAPAQDHHPGEGRGPTDA
jgi:hypothetical protein